MGKIEMVGFFCLTEIIHPLVCYMIGYLNGASDLAEYATVGAINALASWFGFAPIVGVPLTGLVLHWFLSSGYVKPAASPLTVSAIIWSTLLTVTSIKNILKYEEQKQEIRRRKVEMLTQ